MKISHALRLQPGDVVAFVGAGGKTGCIRRIMQEQADRSLVLAATATNLAKEESDLAPRHFIIDSTEAFNRAIASLDVVGGALFTGPQNEAGDKWTQLEQRYLSLLAKQVQGLGGFLLVEADGARRKLFKAPAEHEPVISPESTIVVPVVHIDVLGKALTGDVVHRPERVARLLGIEEGSPLRAVHIAELMRHEQGGLKNVPDNARVRVFINGVETPQRFDQARAIAMELEDKARITSVILGAVKNDDPVSEAWGKTGVVILGAGGSTRYGAPKLLERWKGKGILRQVVEKVLASGLGPAVVVLGADFENVSRDISDLPIEIIHNPNWEQGQSTSVITGLQAVEDRCEAIIFVLGDMPAVGPTILEDLVTAHRVTLESIVAPTSGGRLGNPVLFDKRTFIDLARVEGDQGGRVLFDSYPPHSIPANEGVLFDIDTPGDLDFDL